MGIMCFMVEEIREGTVWQYRRLDSDQILAERPPGAMWWSHMTEKHRPTGPNDYGSAVDLDWLRENKDGLINGARWSGENPENPSLPAARPSYTFADGPALWVQTPGGSWCIDSRASNCTMPYDLEHRCWIRHGEPPDVTVDKNGRTCQAGAGSIQCGNYHGFLRQGQLVQ